MGIEKFVRSSCEILDEPGCPCRGYSSSVVIMLAIVLVRTTSCLWVDVASSVQYVIDYLKSTFVLMQFLEEPNGKVNLVWEESASM